VDNGVGGVSPVASGSVTVTPAATTTYTLTVIGINGENVTATATVTVSVPQLSVTISCPQLVQIGAQAAVIPPSSYVCKASASDGKGITFSANGAGITVDPSSGALTVTATDNDSDDEGNFPSVVITATAKSDGTTSASATVFVTDWFLASLSGVKGLQVMTSKGSLVSTIPAIVGWAFFAPDHLSFAVGGMDYDSFAIYTLTVTSTNGTLSVGATETQSFGLYSNFDGVFTPAYSPDGKQIAFVGTINAAQGVYTVAANGVTGVKQLSTEPLATSAGILTTFPNWSADGTQIFFQHVVAVNGANVPQIWEMNAADGSDQHVVISLASGDSFPTRDGLYLMFAAANGGIYRADTNGGDIRSVIAQISGGQGPGIATISPDGKRMMYNIGSSFFGIANIDGTDQTQISPASGQLIPMSWE
jgi:Tol biopolymer transport system component